MGGGTLNALPEDHRVTQHTNKMVLPPNIMASESSEIVFSKF
jgi:hypothetical protein